MAIRKCREDQEEPSCSKWRALGLIMPNRSPSAESRRYFPKDRSANAEENNDPRHDKYEGEAQAADRPPEHPFHLVGSGRIPERKSQTQPDVLYR